MPTPTVKKGNADQHRNPDPDPELDDDPDDPIVDDGDGDGDDGGGRSLPGLSKKHVLALAVVVAAVILLLYIRRRQVQQSGGLDPTTQAIRDRTKGIDDPDDIDDVLSDGGANPYGLPPPDPDDPLKRDEAIIKNTDIFPSLSERFGLGESEE